VLCPVLQVSEPADIKDTLPSPLFYFAFCTTDVSAACLRNDLHCVVKLLTHSVNAFAAATDVWVCCVVSVYLKVNTKLERKSVHNVVATIYGQKDSGLLALCFCVKCNVVLLVRKNVSRL